MAKKPKIGRPKTFKKKPVQVQLTLPQLVLDEIDRLAKAKDVPRADAIRHLLMKTPRVREAFEQTMTKERAMAAEHLLAFLEMLQALTTRTKFAKAALCAEGQSVVESFGDEFEHVVEAATFAVANKTAAHMKDEQTRSEVARLLYCIGQCSLDGSEDGSAPLASLNTEAIKCHDKLETGAWPLEG